jgi:hypothetical protein
MFGDAIRKLMLPTCIIAAVGYGALGPHSPLAEGSRPRKNDRPPARVTHRSTTLASAASTRHRAPSFATPDDDATAPVSGMVVARDPETGELGPPTPEQMREIAGHRAEIMRNTPEGFTEIRRPDGSVGLVLNGKLQSYSVAHIGSDGKPTTQCVTAASDSEALFVPSSTPEER